MKLAIEHLKDMERGSWLLVRADDKVANYDVPKSQHTNLQSRLPKTKRTQFIPHMTHVAENSGLWF